MEESQFSPHRGLEQTNHWTRFCTHIFVLIGSQGCSGKRQGPSQVKQKVSTGFASPELW